MASLHLFIHLYDKGEPRIVHGISKSGSAYNLSSPHRSENPDGIINVFYEDIDDFSTQDLRDAITNATASSQELWHQKILKQDKPRGWVELAPRAEWQGNESIVFDKVLPLIEADITGS